MTKLGLLFAEPYCRPLSTAAQFQSGCYLLFYNNATGLLATVYRDPSLLWPYKQTSIAGSGPATAATASGLPSDGVGRFSPIYLNPAITYNYSLYTSAGVLLESGTAVNVSNASQTLETVKIGTTARSVTTTVTNDPDLQIAIPAPGVYRIEGDFSWAGGATSGVQLQLAYSGGLVSGAGNAVVLYGAVDVGDGAPVAVSQSLVINGSPTAFPNLQNAGVFNALRIVGVGDFSTVGTLSLKWAQDVSQNTALSMSAGNSLYALPLK